MTAQWQKPGRPPAIDALRKASNALQKALPLVAKVHFDVIKAISEASVNSEPLTDEQKRAFREKVKIAEERLNGLFSRMVL